MGVGWLWAFCCWCSCVVVVIVFVVDFFAFCLLICFVLMVRFVVVFVLRGCSCLLLLCVLFCFKRINAISLLLCNPGTGADDAFVLKRGVFGLLRASNLFFS